MQLLRNQCNRYQGSRNLDFYQMTPEVVTDIRAVLGEGPSWDAENQMLYWVDIISGLVHIHNPANLTDRTIPLQKYVSSVVPRKAGGYRGHFTARVLFRRSREREARSDLRGGRNGYSGQPVQRWQVRSRGAVLGGDDGHGGTRAQGSALLARKKRAAPKSTSLECRSPTVSVGVPTIR